MKNQNDLSLAQLIVLLDVLRDELYEELLKSRGNQAQTILRSVQNENS
ncbi:hypothetical protein AABM38_13830 [Heyndrickxia sp. MSNUG]